MEPECQLKNSWGGKREGAGRPKIPNRVVKVVKMPASYADKVEKYAKLTGLKTFSQVIRKMIEELPEIKNDEIAD